jgi:hypothetical protein
MAFAPYCSDEAAADKKAIAAAITRTASALGSAARCGSRHQGGPCVVALANGPGGPLFVGDAAAHNSPGPINAMLMPDPCRTV